MAVQIPNTSRIKWSAGTLAEIEALGTDDNVAVGDLVIIEANAKATIYVCDTAAASTSTWVTRADSLVSGAETWTGDHTYSGNVTLASASPFLTAGDGTGAVNVDLDGAASSSKNISFQNAGTVQWAIRSLGTSNDFVIEDDAGADVMTADGTTNLVTFPDSAGVDITSGPLDVGGLATFDGDVTLGGASPELTIGDATGSVDLSFRKGTGGTDNSEINFFTDAGSGVQRLWIFAHTPASDNLEFKRRSAVDGSGIDVPLLISHSTGDVSIANTLTADTIEGTAEITGIQYDRLYLAYEDGSTTALHYAPIKGLITSSTSISAAGYWFVAPHDGEVLEILAFGENGGAGPSPGSTVIGVHKNFSGTATDTDTVNMSLNTTLYTFSYTVATFTKGDRISISVNPTNAPQRLSLTVKMTYDTRT